MTGFAARVAACVGTLSGMLRGVGELSCSLWKTQLCEDIKWFKNNQINIYWFIFINIYIYNIIKYNGTIVYLCISFDHLLGLQYVYSHMCIFATRMIIVSIYIYIFIVAFIYIYIYIYRYIYTYIHIYIYIYIHIYIYMFVHLFGILL